MENTFAYRRIISFLLCVSIFSVSCGIFYGSQAQRAQLALEHGRNRSRALLVTSLSALDTAITKAKYSADPAMRSNLSAEIWRESSIVRTCLASMPLEAAGVQEAQKFTAQAGEYARSLIGNSAHDDFETLTQLENSAKSLVRQTLSGESREEFAPVLAKADDSEYPALVYDGPYSEHLDKQEPEYLADKKPINQSQAAEIAEKATGLAAASFKITEQFGAKIPHYMAESGHYALDISKIGGAIINMTCGRTIGESKITREQAAAFASQFLSRHSDVAMKQTYYELADNCVTVNFAAMQDGVVLYPDLIKVIVALDNGEVIGVEARGFIMSHRQRTLVAPVISQDDARHKLSQNLVVTSASLALIPTGGADEKLCYEFVCTTRENTHCLVYINAQTGKEQNILLLLESENGTLTA